MEVSSIQGYICVFIEGLHCMMLLQGERAAAETINGGQGTKIELIVKSVDLAWNTNMCVLSRAL